MLVVDGKLISTLTKTPGKNIVSADSYNKEFMMVNTYTKKIACSVQSVHIFFFVEYQYPEVVPANALPTG
jgi:hypothetical protein